MKMDIQTSDTKRSLLVFASSILFNPVQYSSILELFAIYLHLQPSFGVYMKNHLFGISAVIASTALLISSISDTFAYSNGPNVSLGSNPIVTLSCAGHSLFPGIYQVPIGMDLVITDFHVGADTNGYIRVGTTSSLSSSDNLLRHYLYQASPTHMSFRSGIRITEGLYVQCSAGSDGSFMSGYLAHS